MPHTPLTLEQLNALDQAAFAERLGFVFEGPPWIVERGWGSRPFRSVEHLHEALCDVMFGAGEAEQVALIQAHPDLVGRAALAGVGHAALAAIAAAVVGGAVGSLVAGVASDRLSGLAGAILAGMVAGVTAVLGFIVVGLAMDRRDLRPLLARLTSRLRRRGDATTDD